MTYFTRGISNVHMCACDYHHVICERLTVKPLKHQLLPQIRKTSCTNQTVALVNVSKISLIRKKSICMWSYGKWENNIIVKTNAKGR